MSGGVQIFLDGLFELVILNIEHREQSDSPKFAFGNNGHRLIKRIIQCLENATESVRTKIESNIEKLIACVYKHVQAFVETKGVFILIAILEHSEFRESLWNTLQRYKAITDTATQNPGGKILAKLLAQKPN